ncbi:hypothetical protein [Clostridium butyricum]|uniref:Uncharacterized protein n=1 Tax=Clostridium butyricum TaxID=1492 RepID=A0A2S7FF72_CLOBU|nr:hypothetical protein [Clostridium butyricum]KHD13998.1 hypothetical protein OA81_17900 [Clostridium butyricum]PPV17739.1 hypothetical protein AWN73_06970 [Clostridium butyricum]
MKKYLSVLFLLITMLLANVQTISGSEKRICSENISNVFGEFKVECSLKNEELLNNLIREEISEVRENIISEIKNNLILMNLDAEIRDVNTFEDKTRYVIDVKHNYNLSTLFDYKDRLHQMKELYMERDEELPYDAEIRCLKETLELCPNKKSKCTIEYEDSKDDDEKLRISGLWSILKSAIF